MTRPDFVAQELYGPHLPPSAQPRLQLGAADNMKTLIHQMYERVLTELSLNRFKWTNLPDSVDERYLEKTLMQKGKILWFWWEDPHQRVQGRHLVQPFADIGTPNHYGNPTQFRVHNHGGIYGTYTKHEATPIYGNYLRTPDHDIMRVYAQRLTELDVTIDVNTINMRHPRIIVMSDQSRLTMDNIDQQYQAGVPVIKVSANDPTQAYATLDLGAHHETIPGLLASKGKTWNDALMMLGVPTVNQDKKERMITDEAETGKDQSEVIRNIALNSRKQACERINAIWPELDVDVQWRAHDEMKELLSSFETMMQIPETTEPTLEGAE